MSIPHPAGKQRRSFTDALGRLIEVDEPGSGDGMSSTGFVTITGAGANNDVVTMTVNGLAKTATVTCGKTGCTTDALLAATIASRFNSDGTSVVTAASAGPTVYFTSKSAGAAANYSLSQGVTGTGTIVLYASGSTLTGGADPSGNSTLATPMITSYTYDVLIA